MRIDQWLSQTYQISRSDAKKWIKDKRVSLLGKILLSPSQHIDDNSSVTVDGITATFPKAQYYLLNKPANYVCSHEDDGHPSVLRLLPSSSQKLLFAGRLDAQTTGLVLVSSDGQWCHRVSHPNHQKSKKYCVTLEKPLSVDDKQLLEAGILLRGEQKVTQPCEITLLDATQCTITLHQGKYHQVRRMFAAVGNHVTTLHRFAIGELNLYQEQLMLGQYRALTPSEIEFF